MADRSVSSEEAVADIRKNEMIRMTAWEEKDRWVEGLRGGKARDGREKGRIYPKGKERLMNSMYSYVDSRIVS